MSELVDCINALSAKDIIKSVAKTANGTPFYLQTVGAGGFCTEYQRIYDDLEGSGTPPGEAVADTQNTMVCGLVDAGIWAKFDIFYLFAQTTNAGSEALMNWVTTGLYNAVLAGVNPAFVALEGFTGPGNGYINTNWNPSTNGVNFTLDSASVGIYCRNDVTENKMAFGSEVGVDAVYVRLKYGGTTLQYKLNSGTQETIANANTQGFYVLNRPANNEQDVYRNGSNIKDGVAASTSRPNNNMYVLCTNDDGSPLAYSTIQASLFYAGASLSPAEIATMTNLIEAYMDSNGKGVIP